MRKTIALFALCFTVILNGCETDFEVLAPYKETMVVFGLLDQNDSAQYIKINKAFLGEGDALIMAQQYDSINYTRPLIVKMEEMKNGATLSTIILQKDSSIAKDAGIFNNSKNILYKTTQSLNSSSTYKLTVSDTLTGSVVTSETPLISGFDIVIPKITTLSFDFAGTNPPTTLNAVKTIEWRSGINGRLYEFVLRFHYTEVSKADNSKTYKYIDWTFSPQKSIGLSGGEVMKINFKGTEFYKFIAGSLEQNDNVWRYAGKLDFLFSVASEQFSTYMEVNTPSTGITQEKPQYSNINNGIGIFASRLRDSRKNLNLSNNSAIELYVGSTTGHLNFCDSIANRPYTCK